MNTEFISYYDYLLLLPYVFIFFLLARKFAKKHSETQREFYWLLINWWIKVVAGILYAWMIVYYYKYGDPLAFHGQGKVILESVGVNWENIKFIFLPVDHIRDYLSNIGYTAYDLSYYTERNYMIARICAVVASFTFDRFLLISFVFTNIAYYGFMIIYTTSKKIIHGYNKALAIAILFVPSSLFWSSALAKEPICIIGVAFMFSCFVKLYFQQKFNFGTILKLAFFSFLVLTVKDYIFFCFFFAAVFWLLYNFIKWLLSKSLLFKIGFVLIIILAAGVAFRKADLITAELANNIGSVISMYMGMYEAMASVKEGGGSFINIGNIDVSSIGGILKFIPQGLVNVFFRPYPWEISNVLMIFTVLENLFFIILLFRVLYKSRFFTKTIFINKNYQVFAIVFTLTMAMAIAISTFNFGSMVRYKMPFLPFWATFLIIVNIKLTNKNRVMAV